MIPQTTEDKFGAAMMENYQEEHTSVALKKLLNLGFIQQRTSGNHILLVEEIDSLFKLPVVRLKALQSYFF